MKHFLLYLKNLSLGNLITFDNFVKQYDRKYMTIRCFKYFSVNECLNRSSNEGNVEIVNESLKR
jgi:hypothetical protein